MSLPSSKRVVSGPDLQTAREVPRYDIGNDHTPMKIALWNVSGAASKEEEINGMMGGTNANSAIITEIWLRPGRTLNCPWKTLRTDGVPRPGRPVGGVAILFPQRMGAKIVRRCVQDELNALWVRIPNSVEIIAYALLSTLRNAKLIFPGVDPSYAKMVYRTFIESKMDYARFLCPSRADALHAFDCLLQRFFQCCLGISVRQSEKPRLLLLFNIAILGIRRRTLVTTFAGRLMSIQDDHYATKRQKFQAKKTQIVAPSRKLSLEWDTTPADLSN